MEVYLNMEYLKQTRSVLEARHNHYLNKITLLGKHPYDDFEKKALDKTVSVLKKIIETEYQ